LDGQRDFRRHLMGNEIARHLAAGFDFVWVVTIALWGRC
jgi:hypothetical protein